MTIAVEKVKLRVCKGIIESLESDLVLCLRHQFTFILKAAINQCGALLLVTSKVLINYNNHSTSTKHDF